MVLYSCSEYHHDTCGNPKLSGAINRQHEYVLGFLRTVVIKSHLYGTLK